VPTAGDPAFVGVVESTVSAQSLSDVTEERLKAFLLRQIAPEDPLIFKYSGIPPGAPETDAFAVVSRAVLLLRIATGSAHDLLHRVGVDANALSFWWQKLGEGRGLWHPSSPPTTLSDLWADIRDSLNEIAEIEKDDPASLDSFKAITSNVAGQLSLFSSHERVGLWGLFPA